MRREIFYLLIAGFIFMTLGLFAAEDAGADKENSVKKIRPEAEECARFVMQAASEANGKPYCIENDRFLIIGNEYIAAAFYRDTLELAALVDVAAKGNLLAAGTGPLWRMTLADAKRQTIEVNSPDASEKTYAMNRGKESVALFLRWSKISTSEEKEIISAQARILAEASSRHLKWRIYVDCGSEKRGLWEVDFPRIEPILPPGNADETKLLMQYGTGWVIDNPFAEDKKYESRYSNHPRSGAMQFSALYGPAGGLYLATHDGGMHIKRFYHETHKDSRTLTYYVRNLPENRGTVGVAYRMPYEFAMTSFSGDWFTACRIYREWAIKQIWCSKGPIYSRGDIPRWYKELGYWMLAWEQKGIRGGLTYEEKIKPKVGERVDQSLRDIRSISEQLDVPVAVHFYGWHVIPYTCVSMWDESHPSYKEENVSECVARDSHGAPQSWKIGEIMFHYVCPYTKFFRERMVRIPEKLVRDYDVDGVYYDILAGTCPECFNPEHGHAVGGGNYWVEGNRAFLKKSRLAITKINPETILTSEDPSEVYIDCFDSMLLSLSQEKSGTVPAFQAVYHDYCILFGNMNLTIKSILSSMPMSVGESFIAGDQLGWFNVWALFNPGHPRDELSELWENEALRKKYVDFIVHIARLRYHAGLKFLAYGEMLRPLEFENKVPYREGYWMRFESEVRRLPAVMNSVWKAPDGTLGLVFCNISDNEHTVEFKLNLKDYNMPEAESYLLVQHNIDGSKKVIEKYKSRSFKKSLTIKPLTGCILEVRPE